MRNTFGRFALPIVWDFAEVNILSNTSGGYLGAVDWIHLFLERSFATQQTVRPRIRQQSVIRPIDSVFDIIVTDPPYYDAIPYSDLMDFFYVWLRRTVHGLSKRLILSFFNH